jgi:hypothetical protein
MDKFLQRENQRKLSEQEKRKKERQQKIIPNEKKTKQKIRGSCKFL